MTLRLPHLLLGLLFFLLLTSLLRNSGALRRNMGFYEQLENEYEREKKKNEMLRLKESTASDPYEQEKAIRDKLGLIKDNEQVIIFAPTNIPTPTVQEND